MNICLGMANYRSVIGGRLMVSSRQFASFVGVSDLKVAILHPSQDIPGRVIKLT